jgi:diguanylate cyclase (GGDEF)-like protein
MQPRDAHTAARTVTLLCGVGVTVTVLTFPLQRDMAETEPALVVSALLAFAAVILVTASARFFDEASRVAWAVCPLLAVTSIVLIDLATHDTSVRAQIFFVFSALYGGALLPRRGAVLMAAWSLLGEALVVLTQMSLRDAANDFAYMAAAIGTTSVLLLMSAERQAALVTVLEHRATTDSLTGLVNRRVFDDAMARSLVDDLDGDGTALIVMDVDRFKSLNDEFGHPGGDEILVQLAELLVATSRRGDVVCRLGGDEIGILMPGCLVEVAERRAEQLVAAVRQHGFSAGAVTAVRVSVSAGVSHAPDYATDARTLYVTADAALYEAKRAGRDRVVRQAGRAGHAGSTLT